MSDRGIFKLYQRILVPVKHKQNVSFTALTIYGIRTDSNETCEIRDRMPSEKSKKCPLCSCWVATYLKNNYFYSVNIKKVVTYAYTHFNKPHLI